MDGFFSGGSLDSLFCVGTSRMYVVLPSCHSIMLREAVVAAD